ncbi:MAG: hypothetical protein L0177_06255 [Chloroflexi bacterium]|nr:hypothetical protein [Chloroflexota bacterium]
MQITMTIDAVDVTSRLIVSHPAGNPWSITLNEGAEIDSAVFSLDDANKDLTLTNWDEVIITRTDVTPNVKIFGGYLTQSEAVESGVGRVWRCQAQDYTILMHRAVIDADYGVDAGQGLDTDKEIIEDAFGKAEVTEIDAVTNVFTIQTFDFLRFTGQSLYQLLDLLAEASGAVWYINPDAELVYEPPFTEIVSFSLSDVPDDSTKFGYWDLKRSKVATNVYNHVIVRGGLGLSDDKEVILPGDGSQTIFTPQPTDDHMLTEPPSDADSTYSPQGLPRITVYKNTGTDGTPVWTQQGVGLEGEDTLGASFDGKTVDVVWNRRTLRLTFNTAPPNFTNSVKVRGRYSIQVEYDDISQSSIDSLGKTLTRVLVDDSITSREMAIEVAQAFLNEHSAEHEQLNLSFDHDGLSVGQYITVVNAALGINGRYKCKQLHIDIIGGTTALYTATLTTGSPNRTLAQIFREIHEATRKASPQEQARTDVRRPAREIIEIVDVGAVARSLGPKYYVTGDDGTPLFDLDAYGNLTDEVSLDHFFSPDEDDAGWPLAMFMSQGEDKRRGPATVMTAGFSVIRD